jgi:hypothetical protein
VQRSLAGILFLLASVALALAAGGWWLQRAVLSPNTNGAQTEAILDDAEIRAEINTIVATASASALEQSPNDVAAFVDPIIASTPGATVMTDIVHRAHQRILGQHDEPVVITGEQLVPIVRDERVADVAPITLPVPDGIGTFTVLDTVLTWLVPIAAALGVLLVLLAFVTRPERGEVMRAVGELGLALAVSLVVFGYLLPVHLVPAIDNNVWTNTAPRLALRAFPVVIGAAVVLAGGGLALILASTNTGRRKQWSTPLSVARYREDRSWS